MTPRSVLGSLMVVLLIAVSAACGSDSTSGGASPASPDAGFEEVRADCFDYTEWSDAQSDLDLDSDLEEALDEDYDGVACNDLAQEEYEEGWAEGYPAACEAAFFESPDGLLYLDGVGYEQYECENTDSGPFDWTADTGGDPWTDGAREGWVAACDEFFNSYVGGELFWGDDVVVSYDDCEIANDY